MFLFSKQNEMVSGAINFAFWSLLCSTHILVRLVLTVLHVLVTCASATSRTRLDAVEAQQLLGVVDSVCFRLYRPKQELHLGIVAHRLRTR